MMGDLIPTPRLIARIDGERSIDLAVYREQGCESRFEWLKHLAEENGVPLRDVIALADVLTAEEDFDGLVTAVQDAAVGIGFGACGGSAGVWEA